MSNASENANASGKVKKTKHHQHSNPKSDPNMAQSNEAVRYITFILNENYELKEIVNNLEKKVIFLETTKNVHDVNDVRVVQRKNDNKPRLGFSKKSQKSAFRKSQT